MKVIVFGATGNTGRALLEQGAAAGHEMTAFTRKPLAPRRVRPSSAAAAAPALPGSPAASNSSAEPEPRVIMGDVLDLAAVAAAVKGHDAVMSCLGTRPWRHVDICSGGIATIIPAMKAAGVRRIVAMSSLGVGEKNEPRGGVVIRLGGWLILRKAFRDKLAMERALAQTELDWVVVRPGFLTDGKPKAKWRVADDGSLSGGTISRADTAAFMLQQLTSNEWLRKRPVLVA